MRAQQSTLAANARLAAGTAAAFLLLARVGDALTLGDQEFSSFWPAAGLYFALLLIHRRERWPWIVGGALPADFLWHAVLGAESLPLAAAFSAANTVEALGSAVLVRRALGSDLSLDTVPRTLGFVLRGPVLGPALGATLATLAVGGTFGETWADWWITDALGQLMIAPLLVALHAWWRGGAPRPDHLREVPWILAVLAISLAVFLGHPMAAPMTYLLLPPLLWASLRFGLVGGLATLLASTLVLLGATVDGAGPYARMSPEQAPFLIQSMLGIYGLIVLSLAALFRERVAAEAEVRRANERLEERVRRRTRELEVSEQTYRSLFELSPDGIFVHREGRIAFANAAFLRMVGARGPADVLGRSPLELVAPEHHEQVRERMRRALADPRPVPTVEQRWRRLDGREIFVEVSSARHDALEGTGIQVLARDVTERKQIQRELQAREQRLRLAVQAARMFAFEYDPSRGMVRRSVECEAMLDLPGGVDEEAEAFFRRLDAGDAARLRQRIAELTPAVDSYTLMYDFHRSDGAVLQLQETARALFDDEGRMARLLGMVSDVTAREEALARLRDSEERFATVAAAVPAILFTTRPKGECDYVNRGFLEFTGMSFEAALGFGWVEAVAPEDRERVAREWRDALRRTAPFVAESRILRADGGWSWFKFHCRPVLDETGRVRQWVGVGVDVEDQKRAQAQLTEADRRKDEFLAMLAHELRTPLAPIRTAADLLAPLARDDPRMGRAVEILDRQSAHLARLVDDLLDVSRVTHGKITLALAPVEVAPAVRVGVDLARQAVESKGLRLDVALPEERAWVRADPTRFAQIIGNLLGNAVKYTPGGGFIGVSVVLEGEEAVLRVRDTGMGIEPELLPRVFEPFVQGESSFDRSRGGLGLGLALVRALVELHGGSVRASSAGVGKGATFEVRLPRTAAPAAPAAPVEPHGRAPKRVLLVEDNLDAAEMLAMLLRMQGHVLEVVHDGGAALEAARRFRPEVALLDLGLPILDGFQVARRLREDPLTADCRLIALSGYGQPEDRARSKAAGFDLHLVKPVDPDALFESIEGDALAAS